MLSSQRSVAHLAWRILGDAEEVKEATQETFLRVYRFLPRYDERRDFAAWLYRITVNACRDLLRKRRVRAVHLLPLDHASQATDEGTPADEALSSRRLAAELTRAIDSLPERERLAIILREIEELETDEVAAILGSSPATIRVQVSKARAKIRAWFEARGGRP